MTELPNSGIHKIKPTLQDHMKLLILTMIMIGSSLAMADDKISDDEIKTVLIQQSIQAYGGECPCPYSKSPKGVQCGLNSAYSKIDRFTILCYSSNVTQKMIKEYRDKNGL
ncbi:hypothetical protein [Polynucleobacter sp. Adler-ghost]|jgi:hypothetical protein|uniref:hypothetical protein n=1 Tax=Polynucleobacter sp. Adler-ghost TaxID=2770234 RepID=UPI001BFD84FC|nr:hypothetical protein [Polynucleobacter sp. Adler-ghost]QWE31582.1 hypothetical protein ICV89_04565 [Polynucleobacter sp. Adler-ghost]